MLYYEQLSPELTNQIQEENAKRTYTSYAFQEEHAFRRITLDRDKASVWRSPFVRDMDKILHCPYYSRYADKTQVFSLYKNDDITRRGLHVQLVSRIARTLGNTLHLNTDLIEAISLGHDIGHTPFGHAGEKVLDELFFQHAGRHFAHNIHSVRVLDQIFPYNITLQTLNGIAAHNGELELSEYRPVDLKSFDEFDKQIENCYFDPSEVLRLTPCTLEGCVMRISDIIAYLGKDRQDAARTGLVSELDFTRGAIGVLNAEIINNLTVNILENSYGKPYIQIDRDHFDALQLAKKENYQKIYEHPAVKRHTDDLIRPMMTELYEKLLSDLKNGHSESPIFTQHIAYLNRAHYERPIPYEETEPNQMVVDYIASMTDDYMIDLHQYLFPKSTHRICYRNYFGK